MPELPEAETIAIGLNEILPGRSVEDVMVLRDDVVNGSPHQFARAVRGRRFQAVDRRGKNVIFAFLDRTRIVVNLGMTGRIFCVPQAGAPSLATHPAVVFRLDDGRSLTYDDARRFGRLTCFPPGPEWTRWSRRLGSEPLAQSFTGRRLRAILAGSASPVRSLLLDQKKIAGLGNIYALEALWSARIHPRTPSNLVDPAAVTRLHRAIRKILRQAIRARGTTFRDYRTAGGQEGEFGPALRVYGRAGRPCRHCKKAIRRIVFAGRPSFHCPACQNRDFELRAALSTAKPQGTAKAP